MDPPAGIDFALPNSAPSRSTTPPLDFAKPLDSAWSWLTYAWSSGEQARAVVARLGPLLLQILASWWVLRRWVLGASVSGSRRTVARGITTLVVRRLGTAAFSS